MVDTRPLVDGATDFQVTHLLARDEETDMEQSINQLCKIVDRLKHSSIECVETEHSEQQLRVSLEGVSLHRPHRVARRITNVMCFYYSIVYLEPFNLSHRSQKFEFVEVNKTIRC